MARSTFIGYLVGSSVLVCVPALAHAAAPDAPTAVSGQDDGAIVVTAQRREALAKDVPISVAAVSGETVTKAGAASAVDLQTLVPGLRMNQSGTTMNPTIRGVGSRVNFQSESNIATYMDGVYQQANVGSIASLPDVRSIEVLKGPQGTLFGRNATGGAILINTYNPQFTPTLNLNVSYGRFNNITGKFFASVPVVDNRLAISLAGYAEQQDGYIFNTATGAKEGGLSAQLLRGKVLFTPSEGVEILVTGLYSKRDDRDANLNMNLNGNNSLRGTIPDSYIASGPRQTSLELHPYFISETKMASLRASFDIGPGTLISTSAYTKFRSPTTFDSDNSFSRGIVITQDIFSKAFSQELIYTLKGVDRLNGSIGLFYLDGNSGYVPSETFIAPATIRSTYARDQVRTAAAFGEFNFDVTPSLVATAGLRYSWERRKAFAAVVVGAGAAEPNPLPPLGQKSWDAWTPRFSLLYKLSDTTNVYATYSKGFKSGAFSTSALQVTPANPENLTSYEVGMKGAMKGFSFDVAGYRYDYRDIQVTTFNGFTSLLQNAASARIYGADVSASWRVSSALRLSAGASYIDAKYRSFPQAAVNVPKRTGVPVGANPCDFTLGTPTRTGNVAAFCDVSGNRLLYAPKISGNVSIDYTAETKAGAVNVFLSAYATSAFYFDVLNRIKQPGYVTLDGRIAWSPSGLPGFQVGVYGRNLTDKTILQQANTAAAWDYARYNTPVTYGVFFQYKY